MSSEGYLQRQILRKLKFHPNVLWHQRLHSGQFGRIRVGEPGTPDIVALINQGNGSIATLFLEVKREGVQKLRYEQRKFFENMEGLPKIACRVINDIEQLNKYIREVKQL